MVHPALPLLLVAALAGCATTHPRPSDSQRAQLLTAEAKALGDDQRNRAVSLLDIAIFLDPTAAEPPRLRADRMLAYLREVREDFFAIHSSYDLRATYRHLFLEQIALGYEAYLRLDTTDTDTAAVRTTLELVRRAQAQLLQAMQGDRNAIVPADWAELGVTPLQNGSTPATDDLFD